LYSLLILTRYETHDPLGDRFIGQMRCRGVNRLERLVARHRLEPKPINLLAIPALKSQLIAGLKNARICPRLKRSPACMLTINTQHAESLLQAHLV
jgi:hypothetical protein